MPSKLEFLDGTMRKLDEVFIAAHNWLFDLTTIACGVYYISQKRSGTGALKLSITRGNPSLKLSTSEVAPSLT